jgi:hypothetical protein
VLRNRNYFFRFRFRLRFRFRNTVPKSMLDVRAKSFFLNEACSLKVSVRPEALELVKSYFSASRSARSMALELEFPRSQTLEIIKFVKILFVPQCSVSQSTNLVYVFPGVYILVENGYLFPPPPRKSIFFPQKNSVIFAQHCRRQNSVNYRF